MSSRYTKSIPSEVYFTKESNGWYGGPYVHPPKGKQQVIICKIMEITVGNPKKKRELFPEFPDEKPGYPSRRNAELP